MKPKSRRGFAYISKSGIVQQFSDLNTCFTISAARCWQLGNKTKVCRKSEMLFTSCVTWAFPIGRLILKQNLIGQFAQEVDKFCIKSIDQHEQMN